MHSGPRLPPCASMVLNMLAICARVVAGARQDLRAQQVGLASRLAAELQEVGAEPELRLPCAMTPPSVPPTTAPAI